VTTLNEGNAYLWAFLSIAQKMFLVWKCFEWKLQRGRKHAFGLMHFCCKSERLSFRSSSWNGLIQHDHSVTWKAI